MTETTFYTYSLAPFVQPAAILLREAGLDDVNVVEVDVKHDKPAWFTALSPTGNVPLLRVGDDVIFECNVICQVLDAQAKRRFLPTDPVLRGVHLAWFAFATELLNAKFNVMTASTPDAFEQASETYAALWATTEQHLQEHSPDGPWFANEGPLLVDFAFAPVFVRHDMLVRRYGLFALERWPRVRAWSEAVLARPSTTATLGDDYEGQVYGWIDRMHTELSRKAGGAA